MKQGRDAALHVLDVLVIIVVNLTDSSEDTILLLSASQGSQPICLSGIIFLLLLKEGL